MALPKRIREQQEGGRSLPLAQGRRIRRAPVGKHQELDRQVIRLKVANRKLREMVDGLERQMRYMDREKVDPAPLGQKIGRVAQAVLVPFRYFVTIFGRTHDAP